MNCDKIQYSLLASATPEQPAAEVRHHLSHCGACRALQRRLVQVERQLPLLPVPSSSRRDLFVRQVQQGEGLPRPAVLTSDLWRRPRPSPKERGMQKVALACALAAALASFALAWWAWPHKETPGPRTPDSIAHRLLKQRDRSLASVQTPRERVAVLDNLAQELHQEVRKLVLRPDDEQLRQVAQLYREVVCDNLVHQARQLDPAQRTKLLGSVTRHLIELESEAKRLEVDAPPDTRAHLRDIARASRESHDELRKMLQA